MDESKRIIEKTKTEDKLSLISGEKLLNAKLTRILIWVGLIVACLEKIVSGSVLVINLYINDLKTTFNYSQTEVEIIASALNLGRGLCIFPGMFFDKFGPEITNLIAVVVTTISYFLIWSATKATYFYSRNVTLMIVYHFLAGFGSVFAYTASQITSIVNFDSRWRGKIIGIEDALYGGAPMVFSQIFYQSFDITGRSSSTNTSQYDFPGYMLMLAITFSVTDILCLLFSHYYKTDSSSYEKLVDEKPTNDDRKSSHLELSHNSSVKGSPGSTGFDQLNQSSDDLPFFEILKNPQYNIFLWTFALIACVDFVVINNLTSSSRSLGFSEHDALLVPLLGLASFCSSLTTGIIADYFPTKRLYLQLSATVIGTIAITFYVAAGNIFGMFVCATVLIGIPAGIMWVSVPTEIIDKFGTKHFGRNWGFMRAVQTIVNLVVHYFFGYFYELSIPDGSIHCYGINCIRYGYVFLLVITFTSFLVFLRRCIQLLRNKL